jgi:Flp pilus assembly protein TadG
MWHERFLRDRRGAVAIMFALMAIPLTGMAGLAIDYALWNQTSSAVSAAAASAALDAVTIAASGEQAGDTNYAAEGIAAGKQWFVAQVGSRAGQLSGASLTPVVTITPGTTITATVAYNGIMFSSFGRLFGVTTYPVSAQASAIIQMAPYLNVELVLDNSPSMEIGAMPSDIATLQQLTACSPSGALYNAKAGIGWTMPPSGQNYNAYQCISGNTYDGSPACPLQAMVPPSTFTAFVPTGNSAQGGPSCQGWLPIQTSGQGNGTYPLAGAPCAFACHFDTTKPAGTGNDYFQVARSTIGQSNRVTLRFDLVKAATNTLIAAMEKANLPINNLAVGVFTFASAVKQIYPSSGEAGNEWATAIQLVGAPPTAANQADTGIQPYGGGNDANTDWPDSMTSLANNYLTRAGDGTTAASPRKAIFLVTDGAQDYYVGGKTSNRSLQAFSPSYCQLFKDMGYTVYVVYTPYYPLMNGYYLQNMFNIVEKSGSTSIPYNLQACASGPADYLSATDSVSITKALTTFLGQAMISPARLTR